MLNKIRERIYNLKSRLYIEGQYLNEAEFEIGRNIKYEIDSLNKIVTVSLSNEKTNNKVARTIVRSGKCVPVIDIKAKEIKQFFENNKNVEVTIYKGKIIFKVKQDIKTKIIQFKKKEQSIEVSISELAKVVGCNQSSIADLFKMPNSKHSSSEIGNIITDKATKTLKLLSLFTGIGAYEKALSNQNISYEVVNYCEINKYASKAYSIVNNVSESLNLWDVKKVRKENIAAPIDAMTWSFPCTDLSSAGKKKGFIDDDGSPTRSGLYYEGIRILRELKPRYSIIENVKNLISKRFSNEFKMMLSDLEEAGYNTYWNCYNAGDFNIAQQRERVFIISILKEEDDKTFELSPPPKNPIVKLKDFLVNGVVNGCFCLSPRKGKLVYFYIGG